MDHLGPKWNRQSCPVMEHDRRGNALGRCWFYLVNGRCPVHGDVRIQMAEVAEEGARRRSRPRTGDT